jgi:hypothetical protein
MATLARTLGALPGIRRPVLYLLRALGLILEDAPRAAPGGQAMERVEGVSSSAGGLDPLVMLRHRLLHV